MTLIDLTDGMTVADMAAELKEVRAQPEFLTHPEFVAQARAALDEALRLARAIADRFDQRAEFERLYTTPSTAH